MPIITLPDGTELGYDAPVTALEVAGDIGARLAQQALGCKVDGVLSDLSTELAGDCSLSIVTPNNREGEPDPDALPAAAFLRPRHGGGDPAGI